MTLGVQVVFDQFPALTADQKSKFEALQSLYTEWNEKINVISRKDIDQLYVRHILHSLAIAKQIQFKPCTKILDIGTGGGFPGVPLAILFPESNFLLVDSIGKKIKVVQEVSQGIGLTNLKAEHLRAEQVKEKFDYIVSRAVARTKMLFDWSQHLFNQKSIDAENRGYYLLKGGDLDEELAEVKKPYSSKDISGYFSDEFFETKKVIYIPM